MSTLEVNMGGKAFPNLKTARLDKNGFMTVATACMARLERQFPDNQFKVIDSYRSKESFGDLDILWCGPSIERESMRQALKASHTQPNGPVTSFAIPLNEEMIFQVDLIHVQCNEMESASSYFAFNDLGNLLGRIFHRMGLKLGHKGLCFVVREDGNDSHAIKEVVLTRSWKEALEFVGYDFETWQKGFDTLEDVFRFAVNNPLANRTIFRLDETNHQARVRDRKRKTYQEFLRWVHDPANGIPENEMIPKSELRAMYLQKAFDTFPQFKSEFNAIQKEMDERREAKRKFNGDLVRGLTGLEGQDLGNFMRSFIEEAIIKGKGMNIIEWALQSSQDEIDSQILGWANHLASFLKNHV